MTDEEGRSNKGQEKRATSGTVRVKREIPREIQREDRKQLSLHLFHAVVRRLWVCQSIRTTGGRTHSPAPCLSHALMTLLCVCLQMANLVTSLCCVVLAAVVVAYAQRRSQLGEYALHLLFVYRAG